MNYYWSDHYYYYCCWYYEWIIIFVVLFPWYCLFYVPLKNPPPHTHTKSPLSCGDFVSSSLLQHSSSTPVIEEVLPWQPGQFVYQRNTGKKKTGALGDHKLLPRNKWIFFSLFLCTSIIKTHHTICSVFLFFVHVGVLANRLFYPVICCLFLISDNILFADGFWGNVVLTFLHFHMWMTMNILCCDSCFLDVQMP